VAAPELTKKPGFRRGRSADRRPLPYRRERGSLPRHHSEAAHDDRPSAPRRPVVWYADL